ncbi:hypothetical protein GWO43_20100 [candidate division KSB1 bacterium]|nr:hypothetical protein [candidate division KSB1 bacterium]NIR71667.1 hypothetical protein [candidate division KSB1 bacterium]NIS26379.1 hypothetical protein [candidate division KSB1 bacterium]NIT73138.1 hypothetical protein [candidate division KSB1 bacterium]NIU27065.1 hypothetical protein [candidate division KSB1 bacterium]
MSNPIVKKVLLFIVIAVLMLISFVYGVMSVRRDNFAYSIYKYFYQQKRAVFADTDRKRDGIWHRARNHLGHQELTDEQQEAMAKISGLPYLKGYNSAPDVENVTVYNEKLAHDGLNFVVSADAAKAFLMDMKGNILHEWRKDFEQVWPEQGIPNIYKTYWRRAYLLDDGELLAMFMNFGLIKLDKDSNLLWAYKGGCHHDLFIGEEGDIYVLTRAIKKHDGLELESMVFDRPILEDFITVLTPSGKEIKKISLVDCFLNSAYAPLLEHIKVPVDILHANTIEPIDGRVAHRYPMFQKGRILVSMREIHTIAVIDLEQEKVTWAMTGMWKYQHEPRLLRNGHILVFDNRGNDGKSQALEFDPLTQEIVWSYRGDPPEAFYSREAGTIQRLPNGNTLITESENGRGFEVTKEAEIVWEFFNPYRAGENNELIAALYDVVRFEQDQLDWLALDPKD